MPDQPTTESNPFLRKAGPLPVWAWMGLGFAAALVYAQWRKNKTAAAQAATTPPPSMGVQTADQTPPLIIQNYTTTGPTAPAAPAPSTPPTTVGRGHGPIIGGRLPKPATPATPIQPYTVLGGVSDNNALNLAQTVYGLNSNTSQDATIGASQIVAANPQIDWAQPLKAGTKINVPIRWIADQFKNKNTPYNQGDVSASSLPTWAQPVH